MPNADRAAVAREVLTELEQHFRDDPLQGLGATAATVVKWFRDEHYPAPPAPETVTVDGHTWKLNAWCEWHHADDNRCPSAMDAQYFANRIASDARVIRELTLSRDGWEADAQREAGNVAYWRGGAADVIKERDARIAELETQLQRALDGAVFHEKRAHHAEQERDAARARIAELEQLLQDQPRLLYDSMWQAIDRMGDAVGTLTGPGSNCHVTATRVCETIETLKSERDAALRALEEVKHPVATRETVERVAEAAHYACRDNRSQILLWLNVARAALTAAGFTLEES